MQSRGGRPTWKVVRGLAKEELAVYLDEVVHSSDHLRTEHERFEQLDLTAHLPLHDGPHLQDRSSRLIHSVYSTQLELLTSVVMASTSGVGSLACEIPPGTAISMQIFS